MGETRDSGAHFFRCDFQVHSPRDRNWKGKDHVNQEDRLSYAQRLIDACRAKGIDAMAITDHHDLCFFPYIKAASAAERTSDGSPVPTDRQIIVFPALELTLDVPCQVIVIFDADFPDSLLPSILTALAIHPAPCSDNKSAQVERLHVSTLEDLKRKLDDQSFVRDRYIILPNVTSGGHGSLLRDDHANKYKSMHCVGGYVDGSIGGSPHHLRICNGEIAAYGNKRIALFQTSDAREDSHAKLGNHTTWVKWAAPTAEALRQACLAQESRISQEAPETPAVAIRLLSVSNSDFLGPIALRLNPQYTSLIGSRGTGKSSILEYLRWGLCDEHQDVAEDDIDVGTPQRSLIENTLKRRGASVEVHFDINGIPHIVRRRSESGEILLKIGDQDFASCTRDEVRSLLPIQAYSQKQLSRVGRRVEELNRFVRAGIKTDLDSIEAEVRSLASQTRTAYSRLRRKQVIERALREDRLSIQSLSQQAASIRGALGGLTTEQQALISRQPLFLEADLLVLKWDNEIRGIQASARSLAERLAQVPAASKFNLSEHLEHAKLTRLRSKFTEAAGHLTQLSNEIGTAISDVINEAGEFQGEYAAARADWSAAKVAFDAEYAKATEAATSHATQLSALRDLEQKISLISQRVSSAEAESTALGQPELSFQKLREQWTELHRQRGTLYQEQCQKLTELSDGFIKASALRGANLYRVEEQLKGLVKGTGLRIAKIEELCKSIASSEEPVAAWEQALQELEALAHYEAAEVGGPSLPACPCLATYGCSTSDMSKIAERLTPEMWIELLLTPLEDETKFEYRTKEQEYIPFENASAGQQATALLITLLNQPGPPLIIDQPEDDLDNQVMLDIVARIWKAKRERQLIFSSHNANLVVNGDAELVVCCDYRIAGDFSQGHIALEGAIDIPPVREMIKRIMEGGERAFRLRSEKYGF